MKKLTLIVWTLFKVILSVSVLAWFALFLAHFDRHFGFGLPAWLVVPGAILCLFGAASVLICGTVLSTVGILDREDRFFPKEFVYSGPFRYLRNPMALGVSILMLGLAFLRRSPSILLFACAFFLALHLEVMWVEEPGLEKRFGASYRAYKHSVNRWVPRIRPR